MIRCGAVSNWGKAFGLRKDKIPTVFKNTLYTLKNKNTYTLPLNEVVGHRYHQYYGYK